MRCKSLYVESARKGCNDSRMISGKKVVITGCSRGLGRAMVAEFATAGWTVAGCARDAKAIGKLRAEFPSAHVFEQADVANEKDVARFCEAILQKHGAPDLLLNNAALINHNASLWEISAEEFSRVIDVNIKGPAAMIRHLAPAMMKRGSGVIVNFSSGWGRSTSPEVAPYCATKFAMEGMSQAMSQETWRESRRHRVESRHHRHGDASQLLRW